MKKKCDKCDNPATIHMTEIIGGEKVEKHLCEQCAEAEGITIKANIPISQLLEDFILQTAGDSTGLTPADVTCDVCGMTFGEFRERGQFGCPNDYEVFEPMLGQILDGAQDGATRHVGKVPRRAGEGLQKQNAILRLRSELREAIKNEQYEQAATLRDEIKKLEQ